MDVNEAGMEPATLDPDATWEEDVEEEDLPRESLLIASLRGAKAGFRWASYIVGPIAALFLLPALALMEFGLGTGRGFAIPDFVPGAVGFYLVSAAWGIVIGAAVGLVAGLVGRGRPEPSRASWWAALHRPIRLSRRRKDATPPGRNEAVRPRPPWRQWPFWLGLPVQVAMMAGFLAGAYLGRTVDRRLAEARAAADLDDQDWRLDDLLANRDPVPYAENSAIVVAELLSLMPENWPDAPMPPPGMSRLHSTPASRAIERISATQDNVRLDQETAETLRHELDRCREALQIARTLMYYDRGRHELEIGPTVIDTRLAETQATRTVARLLIADAAIRADDGDLDGALDSCRAMLGAGRSIGDEPFLISQLVRFAIGMVSVKATQRALGQGEPSDAALARLQALFLDELDQPLLLYGVRGERAALIEMIRRIRDGEIPVSALSRERSTANALDVPTTVAPWGKLMYDNQMAVALEWLNRTVDIASRPAAERPALWDALDAEITRVRGTWHGPYTSGLAVSMMPAMPSSISAYSRYEAELGSMIVLLAAERHRLKTGSWPASVEDIDPEILPYPPSDPYSGEPFHMAHREGQLRVYSFGPNRRDEQGSYDPKQMVKGRLDDVGVAGWDVNLRGRPPSGDTEPAEDSPPP